MALSFMLMFSLLFASRVFSQGDSTSLGNYGNDYDNSCDKTSCRLWNDDIVDCSNRFIYYCTFPPKITWKTIKKLIMTSASMSQIKRTDFQNMTHLTYLDLGNCQINHIEGDAFYNLTDLKFLNLSNTKLRGEFALMTRSHFQNTKLLILDLSNCHIISIANDTFDDLIHLEVLNLSMNLIVQKTGIDFVSSLVSLKHLKLPEINYIETMTFEEFQIDTLQNLTKLEVLWFGPNQFQKFPAFATLRNGTTLANLKELSLANNTINGLEQDMSKGLESLETLVLNGQILVSIKAETFKDFIKLKSLILDKSKIQRFFTNAFQSESLKILSLNDISSIYVSQLVLNDVPSLEELRLDSSSRLFSAAHPFKMLGNLSRLNAKKNQIRSDMIQSMMEHLPKLRYLDLSDNDLTNLDSEMFHSLNLEVLLLKGNRLTTVFFTSFPLSFWNHLKTVDLSGNPFECDCGIVWFRSWLNKRWKNGTAINVYKITCSYPKEIAGTLVYSLQNPTYIDCMTEHLDPYLVTVTAVVLLINISTAVSSCLYRFRWQLKYYRFKKMLKTRKHNGPDDPDNYSYDAFICYAEEDRSWVLSLLCTRLESEFQLKLCIQDRDWSFGEEILKNFASSIENSRKTVLILSNAFAISPWSHFEMTVAQTRFIEDNRDNLVLVLFEEIADCNMNPMINLLLQQRNHIEWTKHSVGQELFWDKLKHVLMKPSRRLIDAMPRRELFRSVEV